MNRLHHASLERKLPAATAAFWIIKILTTGAGETTSDYFAKTFEPIVVVAIAGLLTAIAVGVQIGLPTYSRWRYWIAVTLIAIFGTMAADIIHVVFGVPYAVSSAAFALALTIVLLCWHATERTLSIHSVVGLRSQLLYWATIGTTFALGTAVGDLTATSLGLGYLASGVVFAVAIAVPAIWFQSTHRLPVASFWTAYILTRPLGASFADWLGVGSARGGLGVGTGIVSLALAVAIALLVSVTGRHRLTS